CPDRSGPSPSGALHVDGPRREVPLDVAFTDPVVVPHADRGKLAALDEPVHGHVGNPHRGGHLADREQGSAARHERPGALDRHPPFPLPGSQDPEATRGTWVTGATSAT